MAERSSTGLLTMMLEPTPALAMTLPAEVREKLAELELELSEGKLPTTCTQTSTASGPERALRIIHACDSNQNHRPFIWVLYSCLKICQHHQKKTIQGILHQTELLP